MVVNDLPAYCDLTTHAETLLEQNVSVDALPVCEEWAIELYLRVGRHIAATRTGLTDLDGAALVMAASAFVTKLFPLTRPSAALRELYEREPRIGHERGDEADRLGAEDLERSSGRTMRG